MIYILYSFQMEKLLIETTTGTYTAPHWLMICLNLPPIDALYGAAAMWLGLGSLKSCMHGRAATTAMHRRRGRLLVVLAAASSLLVWLITCSSSQTWWPDDGTTTRPVIVPLLATAGAVKAITSTKTPPPAAARRYDWAADAVLLPDWEVLLLLHPDDAPTWSSNATTTCAFGGGASSPARALGRMPSSAGGRLAYSCVMPRPARRRRPLHAPRLMIASSGPSSASLVSQDGEKELLRWSGRLVYHAVALDDEDVLVFAKGVNPRQGVNRNASDVRCVYYNTHRDHVVASVPASTSAQQVFRCPGGPPPPSSQKAGGLVRVTLAVAGEEEPIPSVAIVVPLPLVAHAQSSSEKKMVCACTMVRDVAKFLGEWVVYHAAVGVDRFFLYDNGSQDELRGQVARLRSAGFGVSVQPWPWPKTQEAGFSYAAAAHRDSCEWMAFIDVDEFVVSPAWLSPSRMPSKSKQQSMLRREIGREGGDDVGQISLGCRDFGPSGRSRHPEEGVTQGYTCRRRGVERHKSLVRLESVHPTLLNSVHHFQLRAGFRWARSRRAWVNHYKYQAWDEFKLKFRRRVSTYVADWTEPVNPGSKDRTPGLGFLPVQPPGWPHSFCEVHDTLLRNLTQSWFGVAFRFKFNHSSSHHHVIS
jgi:hypothetical protein